VVAKASCELRSPAIRVSSNIFLDNQQEKMGSRVAEPSGSSRTAKPVHEDPRLRVVIVPGTDSDDDPADGSATHSAEPPFLGEQHATVVSKQPPSNSSAVSFESAFTNATLNPNEMGAVLKGETLGHFRLEEFVGGGGMGVVFRAIDIRLGRTVAVKILTRDRNDADTLRRFRNEAQSTARLDHDNIARVYYVGEDRGLHFIVFEFIEGTNIRDLVQQKGPLPVEEAISYMLQVAEALEHASMRNVIHRDIKPSNVLITVAGRAKLVDMGLARLHQVESDAEDLTASGVTLGTFDYISPEQARDPRTADVRSDLYSLGCTFYFMLTGRPPFPEGTVLQKLLSHSTEEPTDPRAFRPDLDDRIIKTLERLLAKQPAQRYQRPSDLIGHLLLVAERLDLPSVARHGAFSVAPRNAVYARLEQSLPWALPLALFLIVALLVSGPWSRSEPFEFPQTPIQLQPLPTLPATNVLPVPGTENEVADAIDPFEQPSDLPPLDGPILPGSDPGEASDGEPATSSVEMPDDPPPAKVPAPSEPIAPKIPVAEPAKGNQNGPATDLPKPKPATPADPKSTLPEPGDNR
jgi:eukaryotic-like serine/threonine-protein kinase